MKHTTFMLFIYLILGVTSTIQQWNDPDNEISLWMEMFLVGMFTLEYIVRKLAAKFPYQLGYTRVLTIRLMDLMTVMSLIGVYVLGYFNKVKPMCFMSAARLLHRYLDTHSDICRRLKMYAYERRRFLLTILILDIKILLILSAIIYLSEMDVVDSPFTSYSVALRWGWNAATSVKYSGPVPQTSIGKLAGGFYIVFTKFMVIQSGILFSGVFQGKAMQRRRRILHDPKLAAKLIQCYWQLYVSKERVNKIHADGKRRCTIGFIVTPLLKVARMQRNKMVIIATPDKEVLLANTKQDSGVEVVSGAENNEVKVTIPNNGTGYSMTEDCEIGQEPFKNIKLAEAHVAAAIRKIKFYVVERQFKRPRNPNPIDSLQRDYAGIKSQQEELCRGFSSIQSELSSLLELVQQIKEKKI